MRFAILMTVAAITVGLSAWTMVETLTRYSAFQSAWGWDLAYYNQWFWTLTRGYGKGGGDITVRPFSAFATEGPSVWKMNYLPPIRFALLPIYAILPRPETLLGIQAVVFWWVVPAAFSLVRSETKSDVAGLSAAMLVPATPLLWPLAWNDFRELQLAIPFVLWAVHGFRGRSPRLAMIGVAGMLACRQEFALVAASLAMIPPREAEPVGRTIRWGLAALIVGAAWMAIYLLYLAATSGIEAVPKYLGQFSGPVPSPRQSMWIAGEFLAIGMGSWAILACLAPRVAMTAVPWLWILSRGVWNLQLLSSFGWSDVRYAAPMAATVLAAGLVGYARVATFVMVRPRLRVAAVMGWLVLAAGLIAARGEVTERISRAPRPIGPVEAKRLWRWIAQVGPDDGVMAAFPLSAPLSGRKMLVSNSMERGWPPGYPQLSPEIQWVFTRRGDIDPRALASQGFEWVDHGTVIWVFRRR